MKGRQLGQLSNDDPSYILNLTFNTVRAVWPGQRHQKKWLVVRDGIGELGEEAQQEVYVINHTEEILAMLTVEAEVNEVNEADIANKVNETEEVIPGKQMIIDEVKRLMTHGETSDNIIFKKVDQKKYSEETKWIDQLNTFRLEVLLRWTISLQAVFG